MKPESTFFNIHIIIATIIVCCVLYLWLLIYTKPHSKLFNLHHLSKPTYKTNLRVAVCFSGEVRGENVFPNLKRFLIDPLNADVFSNCSFASTSLEDKFLTFFSPKVHSSSTFENNQKPFLKMFKRIFELDQVVRNYAAYDIVVRARPDMTITKEIPNRYLQIAKNGVLCLLPRLTFLHTFNINTFVTDTFFFSSQAIMTKISLIYSFAIHMNCSDPETLLTNYIRATNTPVNIILDFEHGLLDYDIKNLSFAHIKKFILKGSDLLHTDCSFDTLDGFEA